MTEPREVRVKVIPEIDQDALRAAVLEVIAGHAVIGPGETLVIRCAGWTPDQIEQYQEYLAYKQLPFRVLVVAGDELAVAKPEPETAPGVRVTAALSPGAAELELHKQVRRSLDRGQRPRLG